MSDALGAKSDFVRRVLVAAGVAALARRGRLQGPGMTNLSRVVSEPPGTVDMRGGIIGDEGIWSGNRSPAWLFGPTNARRKPSPRSPKTTGST